MEAPPDTIPDSPLPIPCIQSDPTSLTFQWNPPVSDGGSPILEYILTCGEHPSIYLKPFVKTHVVSNLQQHTMYTFSIQARNVVGLSEPAEFPAVQPGCSVYGFP